MTSEIQEPWIKITVAGTTVGLVVAALTFSATSTATSAAASTAGFTIDALGEVAAAGTRLLVGDAAGLSVKVIARGFSKTSEESVRHGGLIAAGLTSSAVGVATALTITVGTKVIEYSIEYCDKISKDVAKKISEAYLNYKVGNNNEINFSEKDENDWIIISPESS